MPRQANEQRRIKSQMSKHKGQTHLNKFAIFAATLLVAVTTAVYFVSLPTAVNGQTTAKKLFVFSETAARTSAELRADEKASPGVVRQQQIGLSITAKQLRQTQRLSLPLFDGRSLEAVRKAEDAGLAALSYSDAAWRGQIEGEPDSSVTLTMSDGVLSGRISTLSEDYAITPQPGGRHVLAKIDFNLFPACELEAKAAAAAGGQEAAAEAAGASSSKMIRENAVAPEAFVKATAEAAVPSAIPDNEMVYVDVLVYYTEEARRALDGNGGANTNTFNRVKQAINLANEAYFNSPVAMRVRLVWALEVPSSQFGEDGNIARANDWLRSNRDVQNTRTAWGADLVVFLTNRGGCGVTIGNANSNPDIAYSTVVMGCVDNYDFAHEMAHNMGAAHNPENLDFAGAFYYSRGHWVTTYPSGPTFGTIMSYKNADRGKRINYFSYAFTNYNGKPTGIFDQRDNAYTLTRTREATRNFRSNDTCGQMMDGRTLRADQSIWACDGSSQLKFQRDGNLVIYKSNGQAIWSTETNGRGATRAVMQPDGNLVLYKDNTPPILPSVVWASNTGGWHGARLFLQADRNLVIYGWDLRPIWATGTNGR